jgi:hypothetical protein
MPERKAFTLGAKVEWDTQAGGYYRSHVGVIVEIVRPYFYPSPGWAAGVRMYGPFREDGERQPFTMPRDHESYIVEVCLPTEVRLPRYYWPVVSKLRKVRIG